MPQQRVDAAIAVAAIVLRQGDDVGCQPHLVGVVFWRTALCRAVLAKHTAGPPLRYQQHTTDLLNGLAATGGT
jgi:hypothetical protein